MSALFDPIANSEDEMLKRANIHERNACVYLRAHIIFNLLFFRQFVITDSAVNLNKALRVLIDINEPIEHYDVSRLPPADFDWLLNEGHIRLAVRDIYRGNFSESLRSAQSNKQKVTLPSEKYTKLIDEICEDGNIYWWNADEVAKMFTTKIKREFNSVYSDDVNVLLRRLSQTFGREEVLTYNMIKNEALGRLKYDEQSEEYQVVRDMLRRSYDFNIPEVLKLDYSRVFNNRPQKKPNPILHDLEVTILPEHEILWPYSLNLYGFASLRSLHLKHAWDSTEYQIYESQMQQFRQGAANIEKLGDSIEKYLGCIDKLIVKEFNKENYRQNQTGIARLRAYCRSGNPFILSIQAIKHTTSALGNVLGLIATAPLTVINVIASAIAKGNDIARTPPNEIKHAVIKLDKR